MKNIKWTIKDLFSIILILLSSQNYANANENTHFMPALECYDPYGRPQKCLPEFVNAAYQVQIEATNTCGEHGEKEYCVQTGYANRKSCDLCRPDDHHPRYLTDLHDPHNPTWWQSETMYEGIQHPNQVNLTLHLGKSFDITYIRVVFYSPRPESFAIYKRVTQNGPWIPYQYYSATCRDTYGLPDSLSVKHGEDESRALCTSEYSDISPLRDGNVAFSSLEGRPSAINFENSFALQNWVTATDIKIALDRLNTFGDEVFGDAHVLKSYFYAIADIAVGARCKCNGHASKCVISTGLNGERTLVCECKHNTDGPDCDKCLPLFNDVEWRRATSKDVNECKPCNCNGYSDKCYFDRALFNLTGHGGHCLDCRENRDGANCEKCKENFYMREDGYCKSCECHPVGSRSLQCNSEGRCQCKPGVTGDKCDRCETNYFQFGPHGCQPCGCDPRGSENNIPSCDPESGLCHCKENVEGRRCKECKPGFFNLDLENRFGCTPCFCYGHTSECQSAPGYSIVSITSNFNRNPERWQTIDLNDQKLDLKYNQYSQSIGTIVQGNEYIYFLASDRFLGDQRASYNRVLKFKLQLVDQTRPNPSPIDIILEGSGTKISLPIFAQGNSLPDHQVREYVFRLHEHPEYQWQPSQSARGFMSILSNLTALKIRASYSTQGEAILDDVELQTAHRGAAGRPATWIEQCTCPEGYLGQFCESCAPGFRHSPAKGGPFMPCIPCDCNKHASICDSETGRCICQHNTTGDNCDQCSRGYYGNALGGTPNDCKKCPCPNDGACLQMPDDSIICLECPMGYFGTKCEQCSDGFYGDPSGMYGEARTCIPCECNGNVDPNAVGNCNRTTGVCLKCIYNTDGSNCDQCLPGHYGDPLALPHGQCDQCSCYPPGTEQTEDGISQCNAVTGDCRCKPNVIGRNCNECQPGYFNIASGNGCENCHCNLVGSHNATCDRFTGQCFCKPGVTGLRCDQCAPYNYGFSMDGCKPCDCDETGSKGYQCDESGQCPCNDNVEGRRCDRCKENKYNRHQGCINCPACYNLVQDAANEHREKLKNLSLTLDSIAQAREASDDENFDEKLQEAKATIDNLLADAKIGAGGGDQTLVENLNELYHRLDTINSTLLNSDNLQNEAEYEIEKATQNFTKADKIIQTAKKQLSNTLDLLESDGAEALKQAKEKFNEYGEQSEAISGISKQARNLAIDLDSKAKYNLKTAKDASDMAAKAYDLAKSAIGQQKNISNELFTNVKFQMDQAKSNLEYTKQLAKKALRNANESSDTALSLFSEVRSLQTPNIDIEKLKRDSTDALDKALRLEERINLTITVHESTLSDFAKQTELANALIQRGLTQKESDISLLEDAKHAYEVAKKAVEKGDNTLREANSTYQRLSGFQSAVQKSSEKAKLALETVDQIENEINEAEDMIRQAEYALHGAKENAEDARKNAQEAQKKHAEKASKEAENIRRKANDTKVNANKLRVEADQLNNRVAFTERSLNNREDQSGKDDVLIIDAKRKVGQAKANATEAESQLNKAIEEIEQIMDELKNLREINIHDLDILEKRLTNAENELNKANLTERLGKLKDTKNIQNKWIDEYEKEIKMLASEVNIIKTIADSLPDDCFKRPRLEP